jgi:hypothetical protein
MVLNAGLVLTTQEISTHAVFRLSGLCIEHIVCYVFCTSYILGECSTGGRERYLTNAIEYTDQSYSEAIIITGKCPASTANALRFSGIRLSRCQIRQSKALSMALHVFLT